MLTTNKCSLNEQQTAEDPLFRETWYHSRRNGAFGSEARRHGHATHHSPDDEAWRSNEAKGWPTLTEALIQGCRQVKLSTSTANNQAYSRLPYSSEYSQKLFPRIV
jgi:hypothetical protein